jgi:hypothetical protein
MNATLFTWTIGQHASHQMGRVLSNPKVVRRARHLLMVQPVMHCGCHIVFVQLHQCPLRLDSGRWHHQKQQQSQQSSTYRLRKHCSTETASNSSRSSAPVIVQDQQHDSQFKAESMVVNSSTRHHRHCQQCRENPSSLCVPAETGGGHLPSAATASSPAQPPASASLLLKRQVFISYTVQDQGAKVFAASILRPALEAAGLAVCMDFVSQEPGGKLPQELVGAAANSMVVVVVLSKSYFKNVWCVLDLDLALHGHCQQRQEGWEGGSSRSKPLVIPVFYDSPEETVDAASIQQHWAGGNLGAQLRKEGPEWLPLVDVARWSTNIAAMKGQLQNVRSKVSKEAGNGQDEELQLARRVVKAAVMHIPSLVDVGVEVVGFEEQEAALAAELVGRLGLWLYGQGVWCWGRVGAGAYLHVGHPSVSQYQYASFIAGPLHELV